MWRNVSIFAREADFASACICSASSFTIYFLITAQEENPEHTAVRHNFEAFVDLYYGDIGSDVAHWVNVMRQECETEVKHEGSSMPPIKDKP